MIDWHSRRVMAWRVSISMGTEFCTEAVEEAIARYGTPEIFNADLGSQFTSAAFTGLLTDHGIRISVDGKGISMLEPTCDLFRRPEHAQLIRHEASQRAVLTQLAALWMSRSTPSGIIGLAGTVTIAASIALDLPADR